MMTDAVGPRDGKVRVDVKCDTCISVTSCRPGACTKPWGCSSWVDESGNRAITPTVEPDVCVALVLYEEAIL
jgi:hypothetical protein